MSTEFKSCLHIEVQQKGFYAMEVYSQEALDHDRNPFLCSHISQIRVCRQVLSVTTVNLRLWGLKAVSRGCSLIGSEHPSQSSLSQTWSPLCVVHIICDSVSYEHAQKDVECVLEDHQDTDGAVAAENPHFHVEATAVKNSWSYTKKSKKQHNTLTPWQLFVIWFFSSDKEIIE